MSPAPSRGESEEPSEGALAAAKVEQPWSPSGTPLRAASSPACSESEEHLAATAPRSHEAPSEGALLAAEVDSWFSSPASTRGVAASTSRAPRVTASALPTAAVAVAASLTATRAMPPTPPPPPPPPAAALAPVLAQRHYVVLQGCLSAALRLQVLQLALGADWSLQERRLAGQPDGRRLRCYMEPPLDGEPARAPLPAGAAELAAKCRTALGACMHSLLPGEAAFPLHQPTTLITLPGAEQQRWHRDADREDAYSMLIAITDRDFWFKEHGLVQLRAGDLLVFKGHLCHAGAGLARDATKASVALHIYGGRGITADVLAHVFTDAGCHGH